MPNPHNEEGIVCMYVIKLVLSNFNVIIQFVGRLAGCLVCFLQQIKNGKQSIVNIQIIVNGKRIVS